MDDVKLTLFLNFELRSAHVLPRSLLSGLVCVLLLLFRRRKGSMVALPDRRRLRSVDGDVLVDASIRQVRVRPHCACMRQGHAFEM
jgi:hypothetical protein